MAFVTLGSMFVLARRMTVAAAFFLVGSACASVTNSESTTMPSAPDTVDAQGVFGSVSDADGLLDCPEGQIVRAVDIETTGDSERAVAVEALEQWTLQGAVLHDLPSEKLWSAVLDGRDVALAFPELDGDGTWVVHDVQACGEPDSGPAGFDGDLDCANDSSWAMTGTPDLTFVGTTTAEEAVRSSLEWYADRYGGEIVMTSGGGGALVVDQREQVIARSSELPAGGWGVTAVLGCDGYEFVR